jgi:dephospho-CoA kinase
VIPTIGLIGQIGAGKSTAAAGLAAVGGAVVDADKLGHAALEVPHVVAALVRRWGNPVLKPDGAINRRAIAGIVFPHAAERQFLEAIVFPVIGELARAEIARVRAISGVRFVALDAAVMLEAGWAGHAEKLLYVAAPRDLRLARLRLRAGWTDADLTAREASQWPAAVKQARADAVVWNDGEPEDLEVRTRRILHGWGLGFPERRRK